MRARNIKPSFFRNEQLADLKVEARLLFIGLWCLADREGRLEDRPRRIKMEVFPADAFDVDALLTDLQRSGLIDRYTVGGLAAIQIPTFAKHQKPHPKESRSVIPPPSIDGKTDQGPIQVEPRYDLGTTQEVASPADILNPDVLNTAAAATERVPRRRRPPVKEFDPSATEGLDLTAWNAYVTYRSEIRKPLRPVSMASAAEALAQYRADQRAVVEQTKANGWQGLFPLKRSPPARSTSVADRISWTPSE